MTSIHALISQETQCAHEVRLAQDKHRKVLKELHDPLYALYKRYREAFGLVQEEYPGLCKGLIPSSGINTTTTSWGNCGLSDLYHDPEGFTTIETADSFRGYSSSYRVKIPTKYLNEGGEALLLKDIEEVNTKIAKLKAKRAAHAIQVAEGRDRAEFARLSEKFKGTAAA